MERPNPPVITSLPSPHRNSLLSMPVPHIPDELQGGVTVVVQTKYGPLKGGRTRNGAAVFLGNTLMSPALVCDRLIVSIHLFQRCHMPCQRCDSRTPNHFQRVIDTKTSTMYTKRNVIRSFLIYIGISLTMIACASDCFQPNNNGQGSSAPYKPSCVSTPDTYSTGFPPEDLKGYGNPSEDP